MTLKMKTTLGVLGLAVAILAGATPAASQAVATLDLGASSLDFRPLVSYDHAVVTLSTPGGQVIRQEFDATKAISIDLFGASGNRLSDGHYRWELRLAPRLSDDAKRQLAAARGTASEASVQAELIRRGELPAEPMISSGAFQVAGGAIVPRADDEPAARPPARGNAGQSRAQGQAAGDGSVLATRDQVIPDDLIVQGSACVGLDCVNNEAFSFDTIRLKENSTRITFIDTSATGFPQGDWQLRANDSSGSGNLMAIDWLGTGAADGDAPTSTPFAVEGGATSNSIFVDSTGRVGFRTSTPVLDLHVNTSNTPALRLEQNNSGGFTAQTWDIGGNEANFFVRDVTGGSRLSFRIRPGAPTSSLDISADGDIGVGTASPSASVDISRSTSSAEVQASTFSNDGALFSNMILRRALGSSAVPLAVTSNSILGTFSFRGHNGTAFPTENNARLEVRAEENFTATANGTRMIFQTTQNGQTVPATRMVIKNDGSVGIGTANPTAGSRLEVNGGSIRVTGGSFIDDGTTLNVPDYVFEPDYELRSLEELASFIAANKHLPGVPSRDDVKQNGLNLSQFQMRLLEKVEELTLYTLKQNETIAELKARLAALEQAKQ